MSQYQVISRKFRPQTFKEVVGQDATVVTLKNALKFDRLAQAYLFCGSKGTGKTTLARIFAKLLNCKNLTQDFEPCNQCSSCCEITSGSSLDVIEIDGASHRGIEDVRQINENIGYATPGGGYKIYIIDEVHMLTKEAFNALLKTLEEPPPKVKFFFATTEPHKILPTILSRCQRFNLNRIPLEKMILKLQHIAKQLGVEIDEDALRLIAKQAEGGLRDAESLFDQILAFVEGKITVETVNAILGLMPKDTYFELDQAGKTGNFGKAFEIAEQIFSQGKDLTHFVEGLIEHYRNILLMKISNKEALLSTLSSSEKEMYESTARLYSQEQCLTLIDYLIEAQNQLRFSSSNRIALEAILLHVMRSHFRVPVEVLIKRLGELEQMIGENSASNVTSNPANRPVSLPGPSPVMPAIPQPPLPLTAIIKNTAPSPAMNMPSTSISVDPTPTAADLGKKSLPPKKEEPVKKVEPLKKQPEPAKEIIVETKKPIEKKQEETPLTKPIHYYDTLLQFAAIELEGKIQKI